MLNDYILQCIALIFMASFMNNFRFDNRSGDSRGSFRRNSGKPQLHDAVCDECGKDCKVPFVPSGSKPVFCSECFEQKGGRGDSRSGQRGSYRPRFNDRDSGRSPQRGVSSPDFSELTRNVEILNNKLDTIITLLGTDKKKKKDLVVKAKKEKKSETKKVKDSKPKVKAKVKVKKTPKKSSPESK